MRTKGAAIGTASNWAFNYMGKTSITTYIYYTTVLNDIYVVVEITPIGIQTLQWKFYIIWTIFNASFVPIVYLFYPETSDRTLEDVDRFFRENQDIFIFKDKDAISSKRPLAYIEHEQAEVRRNSSAIGQNTEANKHRLAAIERANRGDFDDEKGAEEVEKV